jgi:hypothetical protein
MKRLAATLALTLPGLVQADAPPQAIPVSVLSSAPAVDGNPAEWGAAGWHQVKVKPALPKEERAKYGLDEGDDKNQTGSLTVQLKAAVHQGRFYLAVKYPDPTEDKEYKGWEWRGDKYHEGKKLDDMFAVRFHMGGDFDRTMLSSKDYKVDVWQWSAGRSNPAGVAEDMSHHITTKMIEDAAEYSLPGGKTVYIKKLRDAGTPPYKNLPRPKEKKGDKLPSFETQKPSGSVADVAAKGAWKAGHWVIEFARAMNTGNADDAALKPGQKILGQIAVFNKGNAEHKSVSEPLLFDFSAVK